MKFIKKMLKNFNIFIIGRRRVKEQLKKIGGMEFYDVHFSYIDIETMEEKFVSTGTGGEN